MKKMEIKIKTPRNTYFNIKVDLVDFSVPERRTLKLSNESEWILNSLWLKNLSFLCHKDSKDECNLKLEFFFGSTHFFVERDIDLHKFITENEI